jgi:hypothetical protein
MYREHLWYWGESATGYFIMMSLLLENSNESQLSKELLVELIAKIGVNNQTYEGQGFPNPYYTAEQIMSVTYGLKEKGFTSDSFLWQSYHLGTIVDMLVRRNKRIELEELWKNISQLSLTEFKPNFVWQFLCWRVKEGEQIQQFCKEPQSWKELQKQAMDYALPDLPNTLKTTFFPYFFFLMYPHRITRQSVKLIDTNKY